MANVPSETSSQQDTRFADAQDLHRWLAARTRDWATIVAVRIALRVLPSSLNRAFAADRRAAAQIFRGCFVSWAAQTHPMFGIEGRAIAAASALHRLEGPDDLASDLRVATHACFAAGPAYSDLVGAVDAAGHAAQAAGFASTLVPADEFWDSVSADAVWLEQAGFVGLLERAQPSAEGLIHQPLWLPDSRLEPGLPKWTQAPLNAFERAAKSKNISWLVCSEWYRGVLIGKDIMNDVALKIAMQEAEFWDRDSNGVIDDIAKMAGRPVTSNRPALPPPGKVAPTPHAKSETRLGFQPDICDSDIDYLDRATLALVLAGRLNNVWNATSGMAGEAALRGGSASQSDGAVSWTDPLKPGFVVHVDAPWGGGKTSFANFLTRILNPYRNVGAIPSWMQSLELSNDEVWPEDFRRPWLIVNFNAWRHQHVNPPWWVFSEAIRRQCLKSIFAETNQQAATLPPPTAQFAYPGWIGRKLLGLRCVFSELLWRIWTPDFKKRFGIALAMFAAVWGLFHFNVIKLGESGVKVASNPEAPSLFVTLLILIVTASPAAWAIITAMTQTLLLGTPEAAKNYSLGAGDPLDRFRRHFAATMRRYRRPVLVVVDDLDRCDPTYVTELIRGMQTILVSPRIVFLLLGDRDWIEQTFSETHKAMKGIFVGAEHEFGARFVEKAIQYSLVLPDISADKRRHYVRKLLNVGDGAGSTPPRSPGRDAEAAVAARVAEVLAEKTFAARETAAEDLRQSAALEGLDEARRSEVLAGLDIGLSLRSAADSTVELATGHMIEGLAHLLPPNPRQIKRIVNAISLVQEAARLQNGVVPGSDRWQLLARWVVIMTEWPKSFFTMTRYPTIADRALGLAPDEPLTDLEERLAHAIRTNADVMRLLKFSDKETAWATKDISSVEIAWLSGLLPAPSGRILEVVATAMARMEEKSPDASGNPARRPARRRASMS